MDSIQPDLRVLSSKQIDTEKGRGGAVIRRLQTAASNAVLPCRGTKANPSFWPPNRNVPVWGLHTVNNVGCAYGLLCNAGETIIMEVYSVELSKGKGL